jgi:hypothetical protein
MEEIQLPEDLLAQPLGSVSLWECLAARLPWEAGEVEFQVVFEGIWRHEQSRTLRLRWDSEQARYLPEGVPERTVTELAACGLALVLCTAWLSAQVEYLGHLGDRFDYWVSQEGSWYGLEVSGIRWGENAELRHRYREKQNQLRENPYGVSGYIVVVGFSSQTLLFGADALESGE